MAVWGAVVVACAAAEAAPRPIKNEGALARAERRAARKLVKAYLKLIKELEKQGEDHYARVEALKALRLDPEHKKLRARVEEEADPPIKTPPGYREAARELRRRAGAALGRILDQAIEGGLSRDVLEPSALRVLAFDPDHPGARRVLGFQGGPGKWRTARQQALALAYAKAWKEGPAPKPLEEIPWKNLEKALGIELLAVQGQHCFAACDRKNPHPKQLETIARAGDLAFAAFAHDLLGAETFFWSPEPRPQLTGVPAAKYSKPLFLLLENRSMHVRFLETCVSDEQLKVSGRGLGFVNTAYLPDQVIVSEGWQPGRFLREWPSQRMVFQLVAQVFGPRRPYYLVMGLARHYSGFISGEARIRLVPRGSRTERDRTARKVSDFFGLRRLCREAYAEARALPPLAKGIFRTLESMRRSDEALACAFVEYLLAERRGDLLALLRDGDAKQRGPHELVPHVFGDDAPRVDKAFLDWLLRNY
ncbi:MAG: hypothetical protein D6731_16320 [Planctomycetota bacterium]|nr:MAG: hypothetical protein D6731_16320 [Planctomycetota bacterium]